MAGCLHDDRHLNWKLGPRMSYFNLIRPCELNSFFSFTTAESSAKICYFVVVDSVFTVAPIVCRRSLFGSCFVIQYF